MDDRNSAKSRGWALIFLFVFSGCGKGPAPEDVLGVEAQSTPPVIDEISYDQNGSPIVLKSPFPTVFHIQADLGGGKCINSAEIIFKGSFEPEKTQSWSVSGVESQEIQTSLDQFTLKACVAQGSGTVTIKTLNKKGEASFNSPQFSMVLVAASAGGGTQPPPLLQTIGYGHPLYPQPGFRMLSASPNLKILSSQIFEMKNFAVGDLGGTEIKSSQSLDLSLSTGFVQIIPKAGLE